jgi:uncharacterized metal-binding protein
MTEPRNLDPLCALCTIRACSAKPGSRTPPKFCPMPAEEEFLEEIEERYQQDEALRALAVASARTEASGYMRRTRIEDTMDFARRIGAQKLGIAHCIGLMHEARLALDILTANGFEVCTVCCKVGGVDKEKVGLDDWEKVNPGTYETICNPVAQAELLHRAGAQLNIVIGLCVGHDSLFFMHSKAPTTVLIAKDRVLGHNPAAALYTSGSYYHRLQEGESADAYLRRRMEASREE